MAKREFNDEKDIRNFRSKVLLLPKKLLMSINQIIDDGGREWKIENHIKRNYKGTLGAPTPPTIKVYIEWYEAKKRIAAESGTALVPTRTETAYAAQGELVDINKEHRAILDGNTDISNKKELLEKLIKKCIQRMSQVETVQEMEGMTASLEAVVGHYIRETHNLVTTQLKLSGELQEETNQVIAKMVNQNLYQLMVLIFESIKEVRPEVVEPVKQKFYEKLQEHKQLQEVMAQSSTL